MTNLKLNFFPLNQMKPFKRSFIIFYEWISLWLKYSLTRLWEVLSAVNRWLAPPHIADSGPCKADVEEWKTNEALREYHLEDPDESRVTVQTSTHAFHVSKTRFY